MTFQDMLDGGIDFQVQVNFYYYNYDKDERIPMTEKEAKNKEIKYMYCENDEIVIEVDMED